MKYFCPILDKEDAPEDKELPDPSGPLSKVIPLSSIINNCNAEVSKVLKQVKWSVIKNHYTKLTPAQRYLIGKKEAEIGVTVAIRYYNAKQKHLECKKGEANQKQQLSDYRCIRT